MTVTKQLWPLACTVAIILALGSAVLPAPSRSFAAGVAALPAAPVSCIGPTRVLYTNTNTGSVLNGPPGRPAFYLSGPACITEVSTYHWNHGKGAPPGIITLQLQHSGGVQDFAMQAHGTAGQDSAPNANWVASTNIILPAGSYIVLDSDSTTWSNNAQSAFRGFVTVTGKGPVASSPLLLPSTATPAGGMGGQQLLPCQHLAAGRATNCRIVNKNSGKCLGISNNSTANWAYADQDACSGTPSQEWSLRPQSNGDASIVNSNNLCLGIHFNSTANRAYADQYSCIGAPSQYWSVRPQANGYSYIVNKNSGKCLGISNNSTTNWAYADQDACSGAVSQYWSVASAPSALPPTTTTVGSTGGQPPLPCHRTTAARVELAAPPAGACFGPPATIITLYVLHQLPAAITAIAFKGGPIARNYTTHVPGPAVAVTASVGHGPGGVSVTGNGTVPGSVYSVAAPAALCMLGSGQWGWDVYLMFSGSGATQDDVDYFSVTCA